MEPGALYLANNTCTFTLWAPLRQRVELELRAPQPQDEAEPPRRFRPLPLERREGGYFRVHARDVPPGTLYSYRLDGELLRSDPASHYQPEGVHRPSAVVDHGAFHWTDEGFNAPALGRMIFYELHVGTCTPEGTFSALSDGLDRLVDLGVNALELMPVAAFPGERNWGYDGVYPFAVQRSYGGPDELKRLVNACHGRGIAVVLDVVYNHLGPEGNYLRDFGPYFTDTYKTPWGEAVNYDGAGSDGVRRFFLENARHWFFRYHVDALRLDAVHAIYDRSAHPFLLELAEATGRWSEELGRSLYLIAESDLNDVRLITPAEQGGFGIRAQWSDDYHHALHAFLTGERNGYYEDFGSFTDILKAVREGFVYDWRYSRYRGRRHGSSSRLRPREQLVVCIQNHDQVGNRMSGERLITLVPFEAYKAATAALLLGPNLPLLFMGQEYGEEAPFLYFVSHTDPALVAAVRAGRRREFRAFAWGGEVADPQDMDTFMRSKLDTDKAREGRHGILLDFHRELISLRRRIFEPTVVPRVTVAGWEGRAGAPGSGAPQPLLGLCYERRPADGRPADERADLFLCLFNFGDKELLLDPGSYLPAGFGRSLSKALDSSAPLWGGAESSLPESYGQGRIKLPGFAAAVYASHQEAGL